jgi:hypothetical protein
MLDSVELTLGREKTAFEAAQEERKAAQAATLISLEIFSRELQAWWGFLLAFFA